MSENKIVWVDLDDTLAYELDFCKSGFRSVGETLHDRVAPFTTAEEIAMVMSGAADCKMNHYDALEGFLESVFPEGSYEKIKELVAESVQVCRNHHPDSGYRLKPGVWEVLETLTESGVRLGIITEGRSETQRNKIRALGLERFVPAERILISEEFGSGKDREEIFRRAEELSEGATELYYIGDNPEKDFYHPNRLGWKTIRLAPERRHIHFPYPRTDSAHDAAVTVADMESAKEIINGKSENK